VENMLNSENASKEQMGFNLAFKGLKFTKPVNEEQSRLFHPSASDPRL